MSAPTTEVLRAVFRQYARQPVNIALLIILPPLFILALAGALGTFSDVLGGNLRERSGAAIAAVWSASLLAASAAFFLVSGSRRADERLRIAGLRMGALNTAHAVGGALLALITGSIGFIVVMLTQDVASPIELWLAIFFGALAYEALGVALAFIISGDLEGSFVIILVFMLDAFVAGPLGGATGGWTNLFPLHHPSQVAVDATLHTDVELGRFGWTIGYTALLLAVSAALHSRRPG